MPIKIGFSGSSQEDMTFDQKNNFLVTMSEINQEFFIIEFHHGDCIKADAGAHKLVQIYFPHVKIVKHPPEDSKKRAFCEGGICLPKKPYLVRNHDIVDDTQRMICTPDGESEELRSGTWATIRYAKKQNKKVYIIVPDGNVKE
jgi:hypothetical protein